jgi:hypothetical protein
MESNLLSKLKVDRSVMSVAALADESLGFSPMPV